MCCGASKSRISGTSRQTLAGQGEADAAILSLKSPRWELRRGFYVAVLWLNCFLLRKPQSLLLSPLTDWMGPTHLLEGNLFCSKSTDLNLLTSKKYLQSNIKNVFDESTGYSQVDTYN